MKRRQHERRQSHKQWFLLNHDYQFIHFNLFNYDILSHIRCICRVGHGKQGTVNDCIIMADTESSKSHPNATIPDPKGKGIKYLPVQNYVVAWTISIRAYEQNIVTLWGQKPSDMIECFRAIQKAMPGDDTIIYFHNLSWDYVYIRKFLFAVYGYPSKQLATKPHYPIYLEWEDSGLILRDSLILSQKSLEKWANDMDVLHKKAVGKWDYDKHRTQNDLFTDDELKYIENDTLAGVECLDATKIFLNKRIYSMPYTATGIVREAVRTLAKLNKWRPTFERIAFTYAQFVKSQLVYHGGFTHTNRHLVNTLITDLVKCYDFASSYPYTLLAYKMPMGEWKPIEGIDCEYIIDMMDDFAFMFKLTLVNPRLKDDNVAMPSIQHSKCVNEINGVLDNGRVLCAAYVETYITEYELDTFRKQYDADLWIITEAEYSMKDYLPRWLTDYIFDLFKAKTQLKGGNPVDYALAKAKLNSVYGLFVQNPLTEDIIEDYSSGNYTAELPEDESLEDRYNAWRSRKSSVLPYAWGIFCTSIAQANLFRLGECVSSPSSYIYSDTDSCYAFNWDKAKIDAYNQECKDRLTANGYGPVIFKDREYWLGVAESSEEDEYIEFKAMGAKRYCGRHKADGQLTITVAGVPKKAGARCLNNDINNFEQGFIFEGTKTGKKTHTYIFNDDIYIDEEGNECGDCIDLTPCDYELDVVKVFDWETIFNEEILLQTFEEG